MKLAGTPFYRLSPKSSRSYTEGGAWTQGWLVQAQIRGGPRDRSRLHGSYRWSCSVVELDPFIEQVAARRTTWYRRFRGVGQPGGFRARGRKGVLVKAGAGVGTASASPSVCWRIGPIAERSIWGARGIIILDTSRAEGSRREVDPAHLPRT